MNDQGKSRPLIPAMDRPDLDVDGILAFCRTAIPVNERVSVTIAAHRIAFSRVESDGPAAVTIAMHALRAVILARTPAAADCQEQLDYLSSLPLGAWGGRYQQEPDARGDTLAMIERGLKIMAASETGDFG